MCPSIFSKYFKRSPALFFAVLFLFIAGTASRCFADLVADQADIVVGYGATEAARWGGAGAFQAAVITTFGNANNAAANSGTPVRQHVVGFIQSATDCEGLTSNGGMTRTFPMSWPMATPWVLTW